MLLFKKLKNLVRRGEKMIDFLEYIFSEVKMKRLPKTDAVGLIRQFHANRDSHQTGSLHPLLQQNTSDFAGQRFSSVFTGEEFFLTDHRVNGLKLLPGVAYLEMARAAVEAAAGGGELKGVGLRLQNIVWARPVMVTDQPVQVHIALYPGDGGEIAYEIYGEDSEDGSDPVVYSQGHAVFGELERETALDLRDLQVQCGQRIISAPECYSRFRAMGLDYGPGHQGIEQLYVGRGQVLAQLDLPAGVGGTESEFVLHPSLLDAALQATIGLMMVSDDAQTASKPMLPFALQELEIRGNCSGAMWALLRGGSTTQSGDGVRKFDIDLCDAQGNLCVRMKGFAARLLEGTPGAAAATGKLLLQPDWREQAVDNGPGLTYDQHWVFLCESDEAVRESIAAQIEGAHCLCLQPEAQSIEEQFHNYSLQAFNVIKNLLQEKGSGQVLVQILIRHEGERQLFAGLAGLLKTAQLENPKIVGQLIEVEADETAMGIVARLKENAAGPLDPHIRYQDGQRYIAGWSDVKTVETPKIPWKDRGIYLITGGAGGLGLLFAREITRKAANATLILTGRSPLTGEKQAQIEAITTSGARIEYFQADVSQKQQAIELIKAIQAKYGGLHGIIHSAGVIKDNFLVKKTPEEFAAVLAPKVAGVVHLDQASRDQKLDWFILFSSLAGSMGNPGQADYSVANAFLDAYAQYRASLAAAGQRHGQTLTINWPLWQEGGMRIEPEIEQKLREATGMIPLETESGMLAFYQCFDSGQPRVLVAEGDLKRLRASLLKSRQSGAATVKTVVFGAAKMAGSGISGERLREKTENYVKKLLSAVLKLPMNRIEADAPMEKYGIDSVMIMQMTQELERTFGSLSKTLFFEYKTIKDLADYFLQSHYDQLSDLLGIEEKVTVKSRVLEALDQGTAAAKLSRAGKRRSRLTEFSGGVRAKNEKGARDIAIIGVSGRYPGARNPREFWENLKNGRDCIIEIPADRWDYRRYFDPDKEKSGKTYSKWGGFLEGVDRFDPLFFNISPREAEIMDPQERLFLQCVYETLEDAGYTREGLAKKRGFGLEGGNVGVFVGVMYEEYQLYGAEQQLGKHPVALAGNPSSIANRVSYFCNFQGPSLALDTMCSSSLTAIHLACHSLQRGGCELAVAGGVNVSIHPNKYLGLSQGKFASSKGCCESFGAGGDGYVPGEGVGAILLKPLDQAIADGDHIYGVIKATAINHDGKTNGYTVPNPGAQANVIEAALNEAGIDPRMVSYIEAHGTGTSLGDPIEITGLTKAFQKYTQDQQYCAIGSAKSNIGHCESAAGIAGVTKILLQLKHRQLAPSLHSRTLNPNIDFTVTPFLVQRELGEWKRPMLERNGSTREYPRIAGISSFGAGGSNAHVIIAEYIPKPAEKSVNFPAPHEAIVVLSAKNEERLKERIRQLLTAIQTWRFTDDDLADIAYTLQVGREAMEERLALTAGTLRELEEKLQSYLDGLENIEELYRGQVKRNQETLAVFAADEELQEAIDKWIQRGKYTKLLDLWVKGLSFDWNKLYSGSKPRRVSLPTYPFAQERYWVPETAPSFGVTSDAGAAALHPLVQQNTSDLVEQRFSSTFTGREFFLADHRVNGERILPGAAYLEMAWAALRQATASLWEARTQIRLQNIVWSHPVVVGAEAVRVHIGLYPEENGKIAYEIYSQPDTAGEPIVHSQGMALPGTVEEAPLLDLSALQTECSQTVFAARRLYETFKTLGLDYGPAHQGIERLYIGTNQVLAKLALASTVAATREQFGMHPGLMDAAFQAAIGLRLGGNESGNEPPLKPALPFALEELQVIKSHAPLMWALIRSRGGIKPQDSVHKLDIELADEQGHVCLRMRGFSTRTWEGGMDTASLGTLLLQPAWREKAVGRAAADPGYGRHLAIFCEPEQLSPERLDAGMKEVSCLILQSPRPEAGERFQTYAAQVFQEIQNILKAKPKDRALIQVVVSTRNEHQLYCGLSGLLKTAGLENPKLIGQLIAIEPGETEETIIEKLRENSRCPGDQQIRYRGGQRFAAGWEEMETPGAAALPWKEHGVYLISGGAGGLGLIFAQAIARNVKNPTVILTGRSALDEARQAKLKELEASGGRFDYRRVDVTDSKAVAGLIDDIRHEFNRLHGIIHAAGMVKDNFIIKKTREEFLAVLAPKVAGVVNLDQASQDLQLDFFLLCSSLAGAMGNPGQADYSTANAFMDAFAGYRSELVAAGRRFGRTLAVNWPLWQDGGMSIDAQTLKMMREDTGMIPLENEAGVRALYRALASRQTRILVLEGYLKKLRATFLKAEQLREATPQTAPTGAANQAMPLLDQDWLKRKAETYFKKLLAAVIKLPAHRIEADAPLENYGIDSVMVMQLTNQLEKTFGSLSKTLFFEYRNIKGLTGYFLETHRERLTALLGTETKPATAIETLLPETEPVEPVFNRGRRARFAVGGRESQPVKENGVADIAIIGLSGRYPGARNIREFWQNLQAGRDCITEIPKERWDCRLYFDENKEKPGAVYSKWGGFMEGVDQFDPLFFNISPREAELIDPQERLFLQCVYETLEDAGYTREALASNQESGLEGGNVGVFVGVMNEEYQLYGAQEQVRGRPLALTGNPAAIANRISYFCNFQGPSMAVDTMCSSSLTAIYLACQSIQRGACELAIAGGVNVSIHPNKYLALCQGKFVSSKGRCESFGEGGDGYVPGEGVGAVLLKPLSRAVADHDHIYGVIKATTVNHGGKTNGYTVPNPNAQARVIGAAYREADIDPRRVSYIEAHGTGTVLGDPIEIAGLAKAFQEYTQDKQYCALGSVKSNIGHCESAAGISGVTKVLLQLKHGQLAPSLHSKLLNPNIDFTGTPFFIQRELAEWKRPRLEADGEVREYPRVAGISAFGAGGSNAHVVIEEYIPDGERTLGTAITSQNPAIILLSAKNEIRLKEQVQQLLTVIQTQSFSDSDLADIAYTLQVGREAMEERLAINVGSLKELEEKLQSYLAGLENIEDLRRGEAKRNKENPAIFAGDEDLTQIVAAWIAKGKYEQLIDLWVRGFSFDWNKIYPAAKPRRVSLPTYPFAKESYWVPKPESKNETMMAQSTRAVPDSTEQVILKKEWREQTISDTKTDAPAGLIVVLSTPATAGLVAAMFVDSETVRVLPVVHGDNPASEAISSDFYAAAGGDSLYQQVKQRQTGERFLGVIDLTAYDDAYEDSTEIESGKIVFLQKLIEHDRNDGFRLLQVTHKLNALHIAATTLQGARMAGLYRMLSSEYRQIQAGTMDTDCPLQDQATLVRQIQAEFGYPGTRNLTECCYRSNIRYEPYLTPVPVPDASPAPVSLLKNEDSNQVIIITGGTQGIGAAIAQQLVSRGLKKLAVIGREALPAPGEWKKSGMKDKVKRLQSLVDQGARVLYFNTSLTDAAGIKAMVETIRQDLGPVTGVFHCAGAISPNPAFFKKPAADFTTVGEPKLKGLATLHQALAEEPLERFILFSSISSIVPTLAAGQSDYAMANAYLDYFALSQAGAGRSYFKSIHWPAWGETGMAKGIHTPAYQELGLVSLTTAAGLMFLEKIIRTSLTLCLPCVAIPGAFAPEQLLRDRLPKKAAVPSLRRQTQSKPEAPPDLRQSVIQWLKAVFSEELKLTPTQLEEGKPFDEYGVESIMLAQLTQKLQVKVTAPLDPALLLEHSTLSALADYFVASHATDLDGGLTKETGMEAENSIISEGVASVAAASSGVTITGVSDKTVPGYLAVEPREAIPAKAEIAVVGIACRFPGSATKEAYWELLTQGVSVIRPAPKERWTPKENRLDYGGWIEDVDWFDPKFFNISEHDAAIMDPQARIILEESLRAIYDAGYEPKQLSGQKVGVYIGGRSQPNQNIATVLKAPNPILGMGQNYLATNISRCFNFKGPSLVVDTACSSGITGMLFACDALRAGRIDIGLVGAVNVLASPYVHDLFAARNILSGTGEFHIFDRRSNGEVLGEGAGVILLKRLGDAIRDGNQIYGVVKAIAVNNDGQTLGPGSPNLNAQKQVMQEALAISGKHPEEIGYIEVNGGGSPVVDSIEIKALSEIYQLGNRALASCPLGSVKPNVGHLLLTSGLAGFIRCLLSVYHKRIPPFLSAVEVFPHYDFAASRIRFNRETIDWAVEAGKRRLAAQNSFPDGGTNCHLLVEEFVAEGDYRQEYFPKEPPKMAKKHFPLSRDAWPEPSETGGESAEKQPAGRGKEHHQGAKPSLWGEYHEI
jgi:polyketide synthase PksN